MSEYDSNYNYICCPFCGEGMPLSEKESYWIEDLEDEGNESKFYNVDILTLKAEMLEIGYFGFISIW